METGETAMSNSHAERETYRATGEILEVVRAFEARTLPRARWTHAAHLTVALWYALQFDWPEAVARVRRGIKLYNETHGIQTTPTGGYHETLTLSGCAMCARFWRAASTRDVRSSHSPTTSYGVRARSAVDILLARAFISPEARAAWVEPDLKTLDMIEEASRHAA